LVDGDDRLQVLEARDDGQGEVRDGRGGLARPGGRRHGGGRAGGARGGRYVRLRGGRRRRRVVARGEEHGDEGDGERTEARPGLSANDRRRRRGTRWHDPDGRAGRGRPAVATLGDVV